jgi:mono/diheme cytochrome c family protein
MKTASWWAACLIAGSGCLAEAQSKPPLKHVQPETISAADGPAMFRAYCGVCHGTNAEGGGPAAGALKKRPADLTQLSRKNQGKFPILRVEHVIQGADVVEAHGSRDMPVWGAVFRTLGDDATVKLRIENLTNYLESLQRK